MSALAASDRVHLAKLLGMLGSDHHGERDNAARAAVVTRLLRETDNPDTDPVGVDWRRTAAACRRYPHLVNRWEADFLAGHQRFPRLSGKQIIVWLQAWGCDL